MAKLNKPEFTNYATVTRVVDGDTFDAVCILPFGIKCQQRFRLHGVDTPETWRSKTEAELKHGKEATTFVRNLIEHKLVLLKTFKDMAVYGRYEAEVWTVDEDGNAVDSLADLLKKNGLLKLSSYVDESNRVN